MKANHSNKKQQIASTHEESNSLFNKKKKKIRMNWNTAVKDTDYNQPGCKQSCSVVGL